ncbi:MAG: hypothetical protein Q8R15_01095 [Candidatus Micrarchaeota archaeon]|nr:hypothetical protein [Candidatus Micrarchaeota archaeon]
MEFFKTLSSDPRYTVLAVLLVTLLYNFVTSTTAVSFIFPILVTIAAGAVIELALWHFQKRPLAIPLSAIVTSTIISIVLTPSFTSIHFSLGAVAIALLSKHFIKIGFSHVFNPANFGALVITAVNGMLQSWWATSNPLLSALLGLVVVWRINAWFITIPFLATTLLLNLTSMLFTGSFNTTLLIGSVTAGTVLFFSTIMLVEPMTTPGQQKAKAAFGIIAALISFTLSFLLPEFAFLGALAVSNLLVTPLDNFFTPKPANV